MKNCSILISDQFNMNVSFGKVCIKSGPHMYFSPEFSFEKEYFNNQQWALKLNCKCKLKKYFLLLHVKKILELN